MMRRREQLGSTGVGDGFAIVHGRTGVGSQFRMGFGRQPQGIDFKAPDDKPVYHFFVLFGPTPTETSDPFLPALGKLARFLNDPDVPGLLSKLETTEGFLELIDSRDV